jgi:hypothetical protein
MQSAQVVLPRAERMENVMVSQLIHQDSYVAIHDLFEELG